MSEIQIPRWGRILPSGVKAVPRKKNSKVVTRGVTVLKPGQSGTASFANKPRSVISSLL